MSPFRSRNFRLLLGSTGASSIGDWLDFVAVLTLVSVIWKDGVFGLATVSVAAGLPALLSPFVGVIVDRSSPRVVMVSADLLRAAATLGMVFAPGLWVLAPLLAVRSLFSTAFVPAGQSIIKEAVPGDSLVAANAAMQTVIQGFKVLGPAAGGLLLTVAAPSTVFVINSATFVVSALLLSGLAIPTVVRPAPAGYFAELRAGVRFVAGSRTLRLLVVAMGGTVFCVFLFDSMLALVVRPLGLTPSYIGYLVSAFGLGGVAGSLLLARFGTRVKPFKLIGAGQAGAGAMIIVVGLGALLTLHAPGELWLLPVAMMGVAAAGVLVGFPSVVQMATPKDLIGRAWTVLGAVPTLLQVIAPLIGALLVKGSSIGTAFVCGGAGLMLLSAVTLTRQRTLERPAPDLAVRETNASFETNVS